MLSLRRVVKRLTGRTLPRIHGVAGADWYNAAYKEIDTYRAPHWQSHYYFLWCVIADRVRRSGAKRVLDIGCGPGQLASCLFDLAEVESYVGLDFSSQAVTMAKRVCPRGEFNVGDATTTDLHARPHDITICTEVLEHVPDDVGVLKRFVGRSLCTVPNFPYVSHVRHFRDVSEVRERYEHLFTELDVWAIRGHNSPTQVYFLLDGVRAPNA